MDESYEGGDKRRGNHARVYCLRWSGLGLLFDVYLVGSMLLVSLLLLVFLWLSIRMYQ